MHLKQNKNNPKKQKIKNKNKKEEEEEEEEKERAPIHKKTELFELPLSHIVPRSNALMLQPLFPGGVYNNSSNSNHNIPIL